MTFPIAKSANSSCKSTWMTSNRQQASKLPILNPRAEVQNIQKDSPNHQTKTRNRLASEWRFRTALTLLIPTHKETEEFLTRLRKEFLAHIKNHSSTPPELKPLLEALATQCFLNEYVYWQSDEEQQWIDDLIKHAKSKKSFNQLIFNPMIGCYRHPRKRSATHPQHQQPEAINSYPVNSQAKPSHQHPIQRVRNRAGHQSPPRP